jgi:hypothetical protein
MAAMYHIANGERVPISKDIEEKLSEECKDFVFNCCIVVDPRKRWSVEQLRKHPWLAQCAETRAMEEADGGGGTLKPGPLKSSASNSQSQEIHVQRDPRAAKGRENVSDNSNDSKEGKKEMSGGREGRKLPKTPSGETGGSGGGSDNNFSPTVTATTASNINENSNGNSSTSGGGNAGEEQPPEMPRRPKKKSSKVVDKGGVTPDPNSRRPLPSKPTVDDSTTETAAAPTEAAASILNQTDASPRPSNRGGRTESNTDALKSEGSSPPKQPYVPPTLLEQQEELRRMMEEQSRKTLLLQQQIDEQQAKVMRLREQGEQQVMLQQQMAQQSLLQPQFRSERSDRMESPRYAKLKKYTGAAPPPTLNVMQNMHHMQMQQQMQMQQGSSSSRPSGAPAGQFIHDTNSYASAVSRAKNSSLSIRQQAMEELTRNEFANNRNRTISAGVSGACVTPKAGLSRTLPPLQSLREHSVGMGINSTDSSMISVPMLPLRHIASAPTAVLQPIIAEAKKQHKEHGGGGGGGLAPLAHGADATAIHEAEREERRRRKERRRQKQRDRDREQAQMEHGGA